MTERDKDRVSSFGVWVMLLEEKDCSGSQLLGTNLTPTQHLAGVYLGVRQGLDLQLQYGKV